uniref:Uncharacterized protein n=1 Tax=viral metagenome TaxID=1070528 RepID=A0A6C0B4D3_9ZZZZ
MSQEGGRSAWLKHVMSVKRAHPSWSLGDAMKAAKKTYKKKGGAVPEMAAVAGALGLPAMGGRRRRSRKVGGADGPPMPNVSAALGLPPAGGRRRRSRKAKVGGTAYGFTGGPYTGSELSDGHGAFPKMPDATYQGPSTLKGGRRRRGGAFAPATGGNPAQLPGAQSADAPATAVSPAGALPSAGSSPAPFSKGGRRRYTKKGRGYY